MPQLSVYESPLVARYASREMSELFSERTRILTWRRLWLALARAQHRAGLRVSAKHIRQLEKTLETINFAAAARHEKRFRHDVMAHLHTWGEVAPDARPILHWGATSADIVDNADLIIMRDALRMVSAWLANTIDALGAFARKHKALPTLGLTHFQPAQLTTVGKRATLWCYDFVRDLAEVEARLVNLRFRGVKGATGTQASFLEICGGDHRKVERLEADVARQFEFDAVEPVTGQTYSRKVDAQVLATLGVVATSVHKMANDVRILAGLKEIEEPFEEEQVGSSVMPYKRNPMLCERATGLARFVFSLVQSGLQTAAEQWFERTLDDSSNKRVTVPEAFLASDGMLRVMTQVSRGLVVYPKVIAARIRAELPFMASENIMQAGVATGGDRQDLHERIRRHAQLAGRRVKVEGGENDLIDRLKADPAFAKIKLDSVLDARRYIGLAPQQVDAFVKDFVMPVRRRYRASLHWPVQLHV